MHALLMGYGVAGDILPLVRLGHALRQRGHRATLAASGYFKAVAVKHGLEFIELSSADDYQRGIFGESNDRPKPRNYVPQVLQDVVRRMDDVYHIIADHYVLGETVVAAHGLLLGARIAQEKLGVPLATVHTQPLYFDSVYDRGRLPVWVHRLGRRLFHRIGHHMLGKRINAFRARLDLAPMSDVFAWWNSPQMVLGLFPEWYASPQRDWPPNACLVGFPLGDERTQGQAGTPTELDDFIAAGSPPILFSQGSVKRDAGDFFKVSAEVAQLLGRRAIFLTPHAEQVPKDLPPEVRYFGFVPFRLPKRAAAHVHHGGLGTIAYTLAAGIPQITVPVVMDQPDNSWRLKRLGVSDVLRPRQYRVGQVARKLKVLMESPAVAERCRFFSDKCHQERPLEDFCEALEGLHAGRRPVPASIPG
jgi:UDP:flavonoid glycosyltransferase YjiC (YdhE family)